MLIDDLEDSDSGICHSAARHGFWYVVSDGSSMDLTPGTTADFVPTPIPGGRGPSRNAARLMGSGFAGWGAGMGVGLNAGTGPNQTYDASAAGGIAFWAKSNVGLTITLATPETSQPREGGFCADSATAINCDNPFMFMVTAPSIDWVEYKLPFSAFRQAGGSLTWNSSRLTNIDFKPRSGTEPFDIWVDDLRFYNCSLDDCQPTCPDPALPVRCPARGRVPAACRPLGTDCDDVVLGCGPSNTIAVPAGAQVGSIPGRFWAHGVPAPTIINEMPLHVAVHAAPTSQFRALIVVDHFESCVDASAFTGVQYTISGTVSGCALVHFVEDSAHLFDDGIPLSSGSHGTGPVGSNPAIFSLSKGSATTLAQTLKVPFADLAGSKPATPIDRAKVTGLGWAFLSGPLGPGPGDCVADLTIDDVRFY
ncbi:MAG: hypothetical protein ABJA82_02640 [Myxococcales bacterium]